MIIDTTEDASVRSSDRGGRRQGDRQNTPAKAPAVPARHRCARQRSQPGKGAARLASGLRPFERRRTHAILDNADVFELMNLAFNLGIIKPTALAVHWSATFTAAGYPHLHRKQLGRPAICTDDDGTLRYVTVRGCYTLFGGEFLQRFAAKEEIQQVATSKTSWPWQRPDTDEDSSPMYCDSYTKGRRVRRRGTTAKEAASLGLPAERPEGARL